MGDPQVSFVLIELKKGTASVALRFGQSNTVQVLEGWEDLDPKRAARIVADIVQGKIPSQEVADKPYREVTLPGDYWRRVDKKGK